MIHQYYLSETETAFMIAARTTPDTAPLTPRLTPYVLPELGAAQAHHCLLSKDGLI